MITKSITTLLLAGGAALAFTGSAQAHHNYYPCPAPIIIYPSHVHVHVPQWVIVGYDCYGNPIWDRR